VNVVTIDPLVAAERRVRADIDVELLLSIADLVPEPWILEVGAVEFLQLQDMSVKLSRTFQIVNSDQNMMDVKCVHGGRVTHVLTCQTTCCTEDSR
jgi:hypothetical protein